MSVSLQRLAQPSTVLVFAYAPAGLGHLRVTKALYEGLPPGTKATLLPDTANSVKNVHRITSIYPLARKVFEWSQYGTPEELVTRIYRFILRQDTHVIKKRLLSLLKEQLSPPKRLVIIATHFGIAHQVSAIKKELEAEGQVEVHLIVQVTDDSPQKLWYIPNADLLTTPSENTSGVLHTYGRTLGLERSRIKTIPYPISPRLSDLLDKEAYDNRLRQANPNSQVLIHLSIPVSGAGVGLEFASELMSQLHRFEPRTRFHVTSKRTLFTSSYLSAWQRRDYVTVLDSHSDRQIVELYEQVYEDVPILCEVTKPSEQAFKAMLQPIMRGGSILLFTTPVGRQEYDNLQFLRRHGLIPSEREDKQLYDVLELSQRAPVVLPYKRWRGFCLPDNPKKAAAWISRAISLGILHAMAQASHTETEEISSRGVEKFWKAVSSCL